MGWRSERYKLERPFAPPDRVEGVRSVGGATGPTGPVWREVPGSSPITGSGRVPVGGSLGLGR
jgi:hypothetical protein